jgi:hypothetical protein
VLGGCTSTTSEASPATEHYQRIGVVDGVTFWTRTTGTQAAIRSAGRLGYLCNGSGPAGYSRILLCNDSDPQGGIQAGFVPDSARSASIAGLDLHIISAPGPFNLAVNVLGPGQQLPLGPLTVG